MVSSGLSGMISFGLVGMSFFITGGLALRGIGLTLGTGSTSSWKGCAGSGGLVGSVAVARGSFCGANSDLLACFSICCLSFLRTSKACQLMIAAMPMQDTIFAVSDQLSFVHCDLHI